MNKENSNLFTWTKRFFLALLLLLLGIVSLFAGIIVFDSLTGPDTDDYANVTYTNSDGQVLLGYLAAPEEPGPHPGILLIHEWWGLNEGITVLADALASEGYVVFAPDAYRGNVTATVPRALWLRITSPTEQVEADVDSALSYLRDLEAVDSERVASMGFCFGGGHSLQLGLRQSENLALTIMYYGAVVTDPNLLRPLTEAQPVLGIFAEEDNTIFPAEVLEFEAALNSLDIENEITIYPGVGHAFLTEENYDQPGPAGDAWNQTLAFLAENL
ncbi:MAG: dienelactone hydrolase family protein [Candidatus Promineifilaceae bacterium]|nr:dienelactone hydrolase family protein [Candidatus Promineifilaceae bacterium]